jgi:DNA-binding NarL/FixJ family response regulator
MIPTVITAQQSAPVSSAQQVAIRTVIVDADPLQRVGIRSIMQSHPRVEVIGDFESVAQVCAGVPELHPDVLLVGAEQLGERLRVALRRLTCATPDRSPAVVTLMRPDDQSALRTAVLCSVRGFVDKFTSHQDLANAVQEVVGGRTYLSASIAEVLVAWTVTRINREPMSAGQVEATLTDRELQVLVVLGEGVTNTAIARRLRIQEATVRSHVHHILTKLQLRTRTEAALLGHSYAMSKESG